MWDTDRISAHAGVKSAREIKKTGHLSEKQVIRRGKSNLCLALCILTPSTEESSSKERQQEGK